MELIFATNNNNKLNEVQSILNSSITLKSLKDINCDIDIPETGNTIEANASQKAMFVNNNYNVDCFADDTGLEIEALDGEPGVYSARYAGEAKSAEKNMQLVLDKLNGITNRKARFKTVISLIIEKKEYQFEGIVNGTITEIRTGVEGFGYDPIFIPNGFSQTFAEMDSSVKNKISHRALAVAKLIEFLNQIK